MPTPELCDPLRTRRRRGRARLAAVLLAASGCAQPGPESISFPLGRVFTEDAVVAAPDLHWSADPERPERWQFRGIAAVHVLIREPIASLSLVLAADERTSSYPFEAAWDGEPLAPPPTAVEPAGSRLAVPSQALTPGLHVFSLTRSYGRAPSPEPPRWHDNVFPRLEIELEGRTTALTTDRLATYRDLDDFLAHGLAGSSPQRRAGFLFLDARSATLDATLATPGRLRVHGDNLSSRPAILAVTVGDERHEVPVEARSGHDFDLEIGAGAQRLGFAAEGAADGLVLWGAPRVVHGADPRPPVVLITLDTTRRDALGPYNGRRDLTPALDALAERADVYERAYSAAPWTLPSHMSMLTGLYPSRHGAGVRTQLVFGRVPGLARLLGNAGYLGAGFAGGDLCSYRFGVGDGFDLYRDPDRFETRGDVLTGYVEDLLARRRGEPLFLFVNYFDAHGPYDAPEDVRARLGVPELARRVRGQTVWEDLAEGRPGAWGKVARSDPKVPATAEGRDYLRATYLAEVAFMDAQIGRLFAALEREGLFDRALVVVMADHGELLGEGGHYGHSGRLDPELTEVPLIVKRPGQRAGRRVAALVSGVDVFPTVLRAAGIEPPDSDGLALAGDEPAVRRRAQVFLEEHEARVHPLNRNLMIDKDVYGIQRLDFRSVVWSRGQGCWRRDDAGWTEEPCSGDRAKVLAQVEKVLGAAGPGETVDPETLSREVSESLKALGYL